MPEGRGRRHAVVHVGMAKTGSTAIQKSLTTASEALRARGILYPALTRHPHHIYLLPAIQNEGTWRREFGADTPRNRERVLEASRRAWSGLRTAMDEGDAGTVVLSCEHLMGVDSEMLARFDGALREIVDTVSYHGYLRSPAAFYLSRTQQSLKYASDLKSPKIDIQLRRKLSKIARVSRGALTMRLFSRDALRGSCVVRDFLTSAVGLDVGAAAAIRAVEDNVSISSEGMALMQEWNRTVWDGEVPFGHPLNKKLLRLIALEETKKDYTKPVLRPEIRAVVEAENRADIGWVRETFGIDLGGADRPAPPADLPPLEDVAAICEVDPARLERMRMRLLKKLLMA